MKQPADCRLPACSVSIARPPLAQQQINRLSFIPGVHAVLPRHTPTLFTTATNSGMVREVQFKRDSPGSSAASSAVSCSERRARAVLRTEAEAAAWRSSIVPSCWKWSLHRQDARGGC